MNAQQMRTDWNSPGSNSVASTGETVAGVGVWGLVLRPNEGSCYRAPDVPADARPVKALNALEGAFTDKGGPWKGVAVKGRAFFDWIENYARADKHGLLYRAGDPLFRSLGKGAEAVLTLMGQADRIDAQYAELCK